MYLSKLELHGFKSFADRTVLHFDPGITAIVGPNGCGKSNIVDAVRWVIGEQRPRILRSEKMDNVIFSGTADRRPLGMSEVLLTIENNRGVLPTEYTDVEIGRRLYRSGESEYVMNGVQCRLKDVTDLFMDTGMGAGAYSVIELKMIEEIISENADDRRRLFEEAAGITKYKLRRRQTLGKLDGTQADLTRVRDLTSEIEKNVRSLGRQARKAERYREIAGRLRTLELDLSHREFARLAAEQKELDAEIQALQAQLADVEAEETHEEATLEKLRAALVDQERTLATCQSRLNDHLEKVRSLETERRVTEERLEAARRERMRAQDEQTEASREGERLESEIVELQEALTDTEPRLLEAVERLEDVRREWDEARSEVVEKRRQLERLRDEEREAESLHSEQRRELDRLRNRRDLIEEEIGRIESQRRDAETSAAALQSRATEATEVRRRTHAAADAARSALERDAAEKTARQARLEEASTRLHEIERQRDTLAMEVQLLESILTSYEEFSSAVQFLATTYWTAGDFKTVSDVLVTKEADRMALDAALGAFSSCIVVQTDAEARTAVDVLRRDERGRATFIVLDRLRGKPTPNGGGARKPDDERSGESAVNEGLPLEPASNGGLPGDPASNGGASGVSATNGHAGSAVSMLRAVRTAGGAYRRLAEMLLRNCYVVDTLDEARELAGRSSSDARIYARTGEWVDARGIVHGGSHGQGASTAASRLGRKEQIDEALIRIRELDRELERVRADVKRHKHDAEAVPVALRREELAHAEHACTEAEKVVARVEFELSTTLTLQTELTEKLERARGTLDVLAHEISTLENVLSEADFALQSRRADTRQGEERYRTADEAGRAMAVTFNESSVAVVEARNRSDNVQRDLERTRRAADELRLRVEDRAGRIRDLDETIRTAMERLDQVVLEGSEIEGGRGELEKALAFAADDVRVARDNIGLVEERLRAVWRRREALMREENRRAVRFAEVQTRAQDLAEHVESEFGVHLHEESTDEQAGDSDELHHPATSLDGTTRHSDDPISDLDESEARAEVARLRHELRSLGAVNELALESYEEEKQRLEFFQQQQQDLEDAEQKLLETIAEINTTASKRFLETFESIRTNFARIFAELFGADAAADLILEDPGDPLESAVAIHARPGGKRPTSISQLSSGEKAMSAIALLFSIYLVKPSPFCILDEVDAPLDDANVVRFLQLLRNFARETQFILVTHNKRTMEGADRLYGVTMQEHGISRLVGVRFDEAVAMSERPAPREAA